MTQPNYNSLHQNYHSGNYGESEAILQKDETGVELKEGEIICNKCNGTGTNTDSNPSGYVWPNVCSKCQGEKKLDWISAATGVAPKEVSSFSSSGHGSSSSHGNISGHTHHMPNHIHTHPISNNYSTDYSKMVLSEEQVEIRGQPIREYVAGIVAEKLAEEIHIKRENGSNKLSKAIENEMLKLNMQGAKFAIQITQKNINDSFILFDGQPVLANEKGFDNIRFLLSANPGEI